MFIIQWGLWLQVAGIGHHDYFTLIKFMLAVSEKLNGVYIHFFYRNVFCMNGGFIQICFIYNPSCQ